MFTDKINLALKIAAKAHQGQNRKGTDVPYIFHPVAVGMIISQYTNDEATIVAGILHDILEDVNPVYASITYWTFLYLILADLCRLLMVGFVGYCYLYGQSVVFWCCNIITNQLIYS